MLRRTKAAVLGMATAAALTAGLAVASPAQADPFRCGSSGSDPRAWCTTVKNAPNGLTIRSGPGTNYRAIGSLANGQRVEVDCWGTGTSVNGYNIWTRLYSPGGNAWVSDYYLNTGHVQSFLPHC